MWLGLQIYSEPPGPEANAFHAVREEAQLAERAGFDMISLVEHHQGQRGEFSAPLTWLAAIAASTDTIGLATGVLLLPLYNPLLIAEQVHSVDRISGGRLAVGVGLGYRDADFDAAGVDRKTRAQRFAEGVQMLRQAGRPEGLTYAGKAFAVNSVRVSPRPFQPAIPLYGGGMAPVSVRRIARLCDAWLASASVKPDAFAELARLHKEEATANGRTSSIILNRNAWFAPSREQAEAEYRNVYEARAQAERDGLHIGAAPTPPWDVWKASCLLGNADDWLDQLARYRTAGNVTGLIVRLRTPWGPSEEMIRERIEQIGRQIGPLLKHPDD